MSALSASAKGASLLILLQLSTRALTFGVNQVLLRYVSPELLGLEAQLALYSITVLTFSRESIRVAVQRCPDRTETIVNMAYVSIITGIPLAFVLAYIYQRAEVPDAPYFRESLAIYALSCVMQLLTEPAFVAAQQKLKFGIRASSEGLGAVGKCFVTCGAAIWASKNGMDIGVLPFALGDVSYALVRHASYSIQIWPVGTREGFSLLPRKPSPSKDDQYIFGFFSLTLSKLSISLWIQNSFKYVLTQGDSILIVSLASLRDQGAYALASNYGGLIARMLFQPIEESSRNLIANVLAPDAKTQKPTADGLREAKRLLHTILKLYSIIALIAVAIGPTVAPLLLRIVAGSRWADSGAGTVLSAYCYYIPFLAINGLTEAFVAAVASNAELGSQSVSMGAFFAVFAGTAWLLLQQLQMGAVGLVFANCANMGLRIIFNTRFINTYFARNKEAFGFTTTLPNTMSMALGILVASILKASEGRLEAMPLLHKLIFSGGTSAVFGVAVLLLEREYLHRCYTILRR